MNAKMDHRRDISAWATEYLASQGYELVSSPVTVCDTPWSLVMRFVTTEGAIYLKHMPAGLALEPYIINELKKICDAAVPQVLKINEDMHVFLMKDAGKTIRDTLKANTAPFLLTEAVTQFIALQQSTVDHLDNFLELGVPDWTLDRLPFLYGQFISRTDYLMSEGMTDEELRLLQDHIPQVSVYCERLSHCGVPETIVQPDFNTNNVLVNPGTQALTFIDLGEIVISHPFFSYLNYFYQASIHHGVKVGDARYDQLEQAFMKPWLAWTTQQHLLDAFVIAKHLWPIYNVLAFDRLVKAVDPQIFKSYHATIPKHISDYVRACFLGGRGLI